MPKVIMVNEIELKPGVRPEEFERFVIEELSKAPLLPGEQVAVFKVDRGERTGKYAMHVTLESVEMRDRYWPGAGVSSPELDRWWAEHGALWDRLFTMCDARDVAHYVEVGK